MRFVPRQLLGVLPLAPLSGLLVAGDAWAGAGGGSSGFGGGGGGGGGSGGAGGFSGGGGGGVGVGGGGGVLVLLVVVALLFLFQALRTTRARRATRATASADRVREVQLAAAEAAEDDPAFAAEDVAARGRWLYEAVQRAWSQDDRATLGRLVAPDLMVEWARRLDDFTARGQRNVVEVQSLEVQQVGLVNRAADEDDRVVVLVEATQLDYVEAGGRRLVRTDLADGDEHVVVCEFWTLAKRDGAWCLHSIEQAREGAHNLDDPLVATPAHDARVRDEAVFELAAADGVPTERVGDLLSVDYEGDARSQAQDAALADGRFAVDVLETSVRRAVEAWLDAIDGADDALLALADPAAVDELLYAGDATRATRVVARGVDVRAIAITRCDVHATPAELDVRLDVAGVRYREDRDTLAVTEGDRGRSRRWTESWTLTLPGGEGALWRLSRAGFSRAATT